MKKLLFILSATVMLAGCRENRAEPTEQTEPTSIKTVSAYGGHFMDTVESGSFWCASGFGSMGRVKLDIDNDGIEELLFLDGGPTSGVFSIMFTAVEDDGEYKVKYQQVCCCAPRYCTLEEKDGKAVFKFERCILDPDKKESYYEEPKYYYIELKNNIITLIGENGEGIPCW